MPRPEEGSSEPRHQLLPGHQTTTAEGNGADWPPSPNCSLPRSMNTSPCMRHRGGKHYLASLTEAWPFASNCYHGGRNEAFYLGYTPIGTKLYDVDLTSAYTTAPIVIVWPLA